MYEVALCAVDEVADREADAYWESRPQLKRGIFSEKDLLTVLSMRNKRLEKARACLAEVGPGVMLEALTESGYLVEDRWGDF